MVCVLTPYHDVIAFFALQDIKSVENYSGKSWLPATLLNMASLFLKSPYSSMHRTFFFLIPFLIHNLRKVNNFVLAPSITILLWR